jgi:hypothetical protein
VFDEVIKNAALRETLLKFHTQLFPDEKGEKGYGYRFKGGGCREIIVVAQEHDDPSHYVVTDPTVKQAIDDLLACLISNMPVCGNLFAPDTIWFSLDYPGNYQLFFVCDVSTCYY